MLNENEMDHRWIIFLHIQKTAGTTLQKIIDRQYKKIHTKPFDEYKILSAGQRKKIKYVNGHIYFGVHESLPGPSTYITMLRHPVDRVISGYHYAFQNTLHPLHKDVKFRHMSLNDFASCGLLFTENWQTRALAGENRSENKSIWQNSCGPCSNEMFEKAKINLQKYFTVAGLTERFDETLILLKRAFGWKNLFYVKRNVSISRPQKQEISRETFKLIEKNNEFDMELYKYVTQKFDQQIQEQGIAFEKELIEFRYLNKLYCKFFGNHYLNVYEFLRPVTKGFRRWLKAGRAVCLTIVSTTIFESALMALDDFF